MKIALASDWYAPRIGGIELHLAGLAQALREHGHHVRVLTTTPGKTDDTTLRIDTFRLPGADLAISPRLTARMRRVLAEGAFDVVHAHVSVVSPTGLAAIRASVSLGLPVVVTFHSVLLRAVPMLRIADALINWSRAPVLLSGVSELVAGQIRAAGGRDVRVLPNGVDAALWSAPRPAPLAGAPLTIVSAMRLNSKKRPLPLLKAFASAIAGVPSARLVIAGEGPERPKLEAAIARLGLSDRVELTGVVSREQLAALYARSDIFAMPSVHESFGLAAIEARFAGLPVVAMRAGGSGDFLIDGQTALLADDDGMLAAHLRRLIEDAALRARLGPPDQGLAKFRWAKVVGAHLDCYADARALIGTPQAVGT